MKSMADALICEDHYITAMGIETVLRQQLKGLLQIRMANTGKKALEMISQKNPDLILVDLDLPDIPGREIIKHIKVNSPQSYIVVLTGACEPQALQQVYLLKVQGILRKTSSIQNIGEALQFVKINREKTYLDPSVSQLLQIQDARPLTPREYEVLDLMALGLSSTEIAEKMKCGVTTIKTYRARIMNKSGVRNAAEMMAWYLKGSGKNNLRSAT